MNAVIACGIRNEILSQNVAKGVKVLQKTRPEKKILAYEDREVALLLALSAKQTIAARRWIPLLGACSGARAGEIAQLWAERVRDIDGVLVLDLRPAEDGGSFKNEGAPRKVPLHPALLSSGFLDFVKRSGPGPLFYKQRIRCLTESEVRLSHHPSKYVVTHLGAWIRRQSGFQDSQKAPNHAFRHWWKTAASRAGISDSRATAIQGHKTQGEAAR